MPNLDSVSKRASAIGIDLNWLRVYPIADGSLDTEEDRRHIGLKYSFSVSTSTGPAAATNVYRTLMGFGG